MPDYSKIKSALQGAGHNVSADFDSKMSDPAFADRVRGALASEGHVVPESTEFWKKYGASADSTPAARTAPVQMDQLDAVSGAAAAPKSQIGAVRAAAQHVYERLREPIVNAEAMVMGPWNYAVDKYAGNPDASLARGREQALQDLDESLAGRIVSDPLNFVPGLGVGARGASKLISRVPAAAGLLKKVGSAISLAHKPAQVAEKIAEGAEVGANASKAAGAAAQAEADLAAMAAKPFDLQRPAITNPMAEALLRRVAGARRAVSDLPVLARAGAMLPKAVADVTATPAGRLAIATGHGAGLGYGYGAAGRYLGTDDSMADVLTPTLLDAGVGGVLGLGAGALRQHGISSHPGFDPAVTNTRINEGSRELIRSTLPEVLDASMLPLGRRGIVDQATKKIEDLWNGPYTKARTSLGTTNAEAISRLSPLHGTTQEAFEQEMLGSLGTAVTKPVAELRARNSKRLDPETAEGSAQKLTQLEKDRIHTSLESEIQRLLPGHPQANTLLDNLNKVLDASKTLGEFEQRAFTNSPLSTIDVWLKGPKSGIPASGIEADLRGRLQKEGVTGSDIFAKLPAGTEAPELPSMVTSRTDRLMDELRARQYAAEHTSAAKALEKQEKPDPAANATRHLSEIGVSDIIDPTVLADFRTAKSNNNMYRNHDAMSADVKAAQAAVDNAHRDVINSQLEAIPEYADALGGARGEMAKWKAYETLGKYLGNTGVGFSRLNIGPLQAKVDPAMAAHAFVKGGNLLQRLIPNVALAGSKIDNTKSKEKR